MRDRTGLSTDRRRGRLRRAWGAGLATALMVALAPAALAADQDGGTYLALGDSLAAGTQAPAPFTENGYPNELFDDVRARYGVDTFVNLACPGEDTDEMQSGIGSACYGPGAPLPPGGISQLAAAVAYLSADPGEVKLITISIGANDVLACGRDLPPADLEACVAGQLGQIATNLPVIIGTLRAVAPGTPIVAVNNYNPTLAYWVTGPAGRDLAARTQTLTSTYNATLQAIYDAIGVPVVDAAAAFGAFRTSGGKVPKNVKEVCRLTRMCEKSGRTYVLSDWNPGTPGPQPDIHPSDKGHDVIAREHRKLIWRLGLLD